MVTKFEEGETYRNRSMDKDVMVYAVAGESNEDVTLAVGFVDRATEEMTSTGEIKIKKADFKDWELLGIE